MASNFPEGSGLPPAGDARFPPPPNRPGGPLIPAGMVERIKAILLTPKTEWPRIDATPMTAQGVFMSWAVPLAAIGPVCGLIGQQVFGYGAFGFSWKPSLAFSISTAVIGYVMALVGTWALALIIDALAPTFNGVKSRDQAMKVAAFSMTASWLAGVFGLIPMLSILGLMGLYSLYLLWLGLPILMRSPAEKSASYAVATIVAAIVVYIVIGAITGGLARAFAPGAVGMGVISATDSAGDKASFDLSKLEAAGKQIENAANGVQQAAKANAAGAKGATSAVPSDQLQAMLPSSVDGFNRESVESSGGSAAGIGGSTAKATYVSGDSRFTLTITDSAAMGALASLGGALNVNSNKETATGYEKTHMEGGNMVSEKWDSANHNGSYSTMVASRFMIEAEGGAPSIDALKGAVAAIDQGKLASLAHS